MAAHHRVVDLELLVAAADPDVRAGDLVAVEIERDALAGLEADYHFGVSQRRLRNILLENVRDLTAS